MAIKLGDALVFLGVKDDGLKRGLDQSERDTRTWVDRVSDGIGHALGDIITNGILSVGRGIAQAGADMVRFSEDSRQAIRNIQADLNSTTEEATILGEVAKRVWAQGFGDNVLQAAEVVAQVRKQLGQLTAEQIQDAAAVSLALQDAYGPPVQKSIDATRTLIEDLGLSQGEAADFIAAGFQRGLDRSGDFLESITEYGPQMAAAKVTAGEFFSLMETGLAGGVLGTDKAADAFKEFRVRLLDGSATTAAALNMIGVSVEDITARINSGETTWAEAFQGVVNDLAAIDDQSTRVQAGVGLLGTQFEDLGATAADINLAAVAMEDLAGSAEAVMIRYNGLGDFIKQMGRRLTVALEPAVGVFLEMFSQATPTIEAFFKRVEDNATVFASGFAAIMRSVVPIIGSIFKTIRGDTGKELEGTAGEAGAWGRNIVLQLARGMASAVTAVIQVIGRIGEVIRHWFQPGSPPLIANDIDKWGADTIRVWLGAMEGAAVSGFNSLSGRITGLFKQFGKQDDPGIFDQIMGSREALAGAFRDIESMGSVSAANMESLRQALQSLPDAALDYVDAALQVASAERQVQEARAAVNEVNERYAESLRPISQELQAIQDARANEGDEKRIAQLQAAIARGRLSDEDKLLAQREIRERQLRIQQRNLQAQHREESQAAAEELDAAEEQFNALQEELDLREGILEAMTDQTDLIADQRDLLDSLADTIGNMAAAADSLAAGLGSLAGDGLGLDGLGAGLGEDPLGLEGLTDDLDIEGLVQEIEEIFKPVGDQIEGLKGSWEGVGEAWRTWWDGIKPDINGRLAGLWELLTETWSIGWDGLMSKFEAFRLLFSGDFAGFLEEWTTGSEETRTRLLEVLGTLWEEYILPILQNIATGFVTWVQETDWEAVGEWIKEKIAERFDKTWGRLAEILAQLWIDFKKWFTETDWESVGYDLMTRLLDTLAKLWEGGGRLAGSVKDTLDNFFDRVVSWFTDTDWAGLAVEVANGIIDGLEDAAGQVYGALTDLASGMFQAWADWWAARSPSKKMSDFAETAIAGGVVQGASRASRDLRQAGQDMAADTFGGFAGATPSGGGLAGGNPISLHFDRLVLEDSTAVRAFFEYLSVLNTDADLTRLFGLFGA